MLLCHCRVVLVVAVLVWSSCVMIVTTCSVLLSMYTVHVIGIHCTGSHCWSSLGTASEHSTAASAVKYLTIP